MRANPKTQRGFTLLECVVAIGVLAVGSLATATLVDYMTRATSDVSSKTEALALATRLVAEIQDARMIIGNADPGLVDGAGAPLSNTMGEINAPVAGSSIASVGRFEPGATGPGGPNPTLEVRYEVRNCVTCVDPFATGTASLGGIEVLVSVYNVPPHRKLVRPVRLMVRKEFSPPGASAGVAVRGW